jgi:hypothetical protein
MREEENPALAMSGMIVAIITIFIWAIVLK